MIRGGASCQRKSSQQRLTLRKDSRKLDTIFEYDADNRLQRTINSDMMEEYDIHIISDPHTKK